MSALRPLAKPHAVYVIYGPRDLILYIGISRDPRARMAGHKCKNKATWWPWVERTETAWYPDHWTARAEETRLIRAHRPPCNPVIPEESGKHVTHTKAGPATSLWARATALAESRGETMEEFLLRALERENARLQQAGKES